MTNRELEGKVALVTGAASGIGRAIAQALLEQGAQVAAFDLDASGLRALSRDHGSSVHTHHVDISDADAVDDHVASVERVLGPIELLVNAAGVLVSGRLTSRELDRAAFQRVLAVNLEGVWTVTRAAVRGMVQRRRGAVVTVSSNAATTPRMGMGAYCASKAAATMLTQCFGLELAEHGVRCNVVSPGSTDTPMLRRMLGASDTASLVAGDASTFRVGIPLGRVARVEEVAAAALFLLSERSRHITMHDLRVDGGATW